MARPRPDLGEELIVLTAEETQLLRFTCELGAAGESPLGPLVEFESPEKVRDAAHSLLSRGLAEAKGFRPHRELLRRALIAAEPDARIVFVEAMASGQERLLDLYQRAGAYLPYRAIADGHELGRPRELEEVFDDIMGRFAPRRSAGDFVDLTFDATEYFAFSILAGDLLARRGKAKVAASNGLAVRVTSPHDEEGTPIHGLLRGLPPEAGGALVPDAAAWTRAIEGLEAQNIVAPRGDRYVLRPYLQDLALGLARQHRFVLTRFDFGRDDWIARDATFVSVPGSLFHVRTAKDRAIRIQELDAEGLRNTIRRVIDPIGGRDLGAPDDQSS